MWLVSRQALDVLVQNLSVRTARTAVSDLTRPVQPESGPGGLGTASYSGCQNGPKRVGARFRSSETRLRPLLRSTLERPGDPLETVCYLGRGRGRPLASRPERSLNLAAGRGTGPGLSLL